MTEQDARQVESAKNIKQGIGWLVVALLVWLVGASEGGSFAVFANLVASVSALVGGVLLLAGLFRS